MEKIDNETKTNRMDQLKEKTVDMFSKYSMVFIFIFLLILFQILTDRIIFRPLNITNLILQNAYVLVLGLCMLLVVLLGNVDLLVGSVLAFFGAIAVDLLLALGVIPYIDIHL